MNKQKYEAQLKIKNLSFVYSFCFITKLETDEADVLLECFKSNSRQFLLKWNNTHDFWYCCACVIEVCTLLVLLYIYDRNVLQPQLSIFVQYQKYIMSYSQLSIFVQQKHKLSHTFTVTDTSTFTQKQHKLLTYVHNYQNSLKEKKISTNIK